MNVHIILEDDCVDLRLKKVSLLEILEQYPNFKETSLEDAEYLIIIPNYPMTGKQEFNQSLEKIILEESDYIDADKVLLLDCDNTFFLLDGETPTYKGVHFLDKNLKIAEVFGLSPKDIKQATYFIKTGKTPETTKTLREQEFFDWKNPPIQEIKPKKRKMLLGL